MLTRFFAWYVGLAERYPYVLLPVYFGLTVLAGVLASRLELHTDFAELLPDKHPAVVAFRDIVSRQKSATNLVMIAHSPDADADHRFAEALRPELDKLVAEHIFTSVEWHPDQEAPAFLARFKWLYADRPQLEQAEDLLDRVIAKRTSPLMVDLDGDPDDELKKLRTSMEQQLPPTRAATDNQYFESTDNGQTWLGIMMWRKRDGLATAGDHEMLKRVQDVVKKLNPASFHPQLKVEYTGHIAQAIDEQNGIQDDLEVATFICLCGVLGVVLLYFRRFLVLPVVGLPAICGLVFALAVAAVHAKWLNLNTAFLVSIILGNGINSPIIVMARFGEERRRERSVHDALVAALTETFAGTLTAMVAAAIAYGSLLATTFRGFSQFGVIGGAGMLLVWIMTFALLPPLIIVGERFLPGWLTPPESWVRPAFAAIGRTIGRWPVWAGLGTVVICALLVKPAREYVRDPLEWNFSNLRTEATPSQKLWRRMEVMGMGDVGAGRVGNDGVFLVDEPEQAETVAAAVRKKDAADPTLRMIKTVRTLKSLMPDDVDAKLAVLGRIRKKIDKHKRLLEGEELKEADAWRPPDGLRMPTHAELPKIWLDAFTEVDGHVGRFIGVDADNKHYRSNNGHDLLRLGRALQVDALGKTWVAASAGTLFGGMIQAIIDDGPRVTVVALVGVTLLVLLMFGPRGAVPVLLSLAMGLYWLVGVLGLWDRMGAHAWRGAYAKLNFMNFVAVPITLGVGADYAANIWARIKREPSASLATVIGDTGSAVALCSMTTIIGYSTLLLSRNHALRSFGLVAVLGELMCLTAALVGMPLLARLFRRATA
jgi:predicted RND superfamily exporter protein